MPQARTDLLDQVALGGRVDAVLAGYLTERRRELDAIDPRLAALTDATSGLLAAGGKRVRPAFCYWGWCGAGAADRPEVVRAAAALELLHASALLHDDLMDASDLRRGRPAAHRAFAAQHRDAGWRGEPAEFGAAAAILAGDLCLIWADGMWHGCGLAAAALRRAAPVYDAMRVELMAGQFLDVLETATPVGTVAGALRVARYKTANYTVTRPLQLGGALAGASPALLAAFAAFGQPLGEAFQLRDDVLGVFGDPGRTGKPAGDDLRAGKRTVLVALAGELGSTAEQRELADRLGEPDLDPAGVARLQRLIVESGALAEVERMIAERTASALAVLAGAPLPDSVRAMLASAATAATQRDC